MSTQPKKKRKRNPNQLPNTKVPPPEVIEEIMKFAKVSSLFDIAIALGLDPVWLDKALHRGRELRTLRKGGPLAAFAARWDGAQRLRELELKLWMHEHAKDDPTAAFKLEELRRREAGLPAGRKALRLPQQEAFVQLLSGGAKATTAYLQVYQCKKDAAITSASALLALPHIKERLEFLQSINAGLRNITKNERQTICHTIANSEASTDRDRLYALKVDAELKGDLIRTRDLVTDDGEAMPSVLPNIIIKLPKSFVTGRGSKQVPREA